MDNDICSLIERLEEILRHVEDQNLDDELHVALEMGHQFREELNIHCEE
jgi:hypothetical protein